MITDLNICDDIKNHDKSEKLFKQNILSQMGWKLGR
mgnify:CR=1 FL=1